MTSADANASARAAWSRNAEFWDRHMGEGNDFVEVLTWPSLARLLDVQPSQRIVDIACGNGLIARRCARLGARVVAFDFAPEMIALARTHSAGADIDYRVLDATDETALAGLEDRSFDAAVSNMSLMDMADLRPLMRTVARVLKPGGRFVFSTMHPCFNNPSTVLVGELEDRAGELVATHAVKTTAYRTPQTRPGLAIRGQPVPHLYFHRSLADLLATAFEAGMVADALEEPAFPPDTAGSDALGWNGRLSEIPPALVVRLRTPSLQP